MAVATRSGNGGGGGGGAEDEEDSHSWPTVNERSSELFSSFHFIFFLRIEFFLFIFRFLWE